MKKIRTIESAYKEIHKRDPNSNLSRSCLLKLVVTGEIASKKSGNRYLVTLEDIDSYFDT